MAQIFGRNSNWMARLVLLFLLVSVVSVLVWAEMIDRSDYVTGRSMYVEQPIPFSHQHHVGELKIDCRFCHTQVEKSAQASIPSAKVCMICHSQIWKTSAMLKPVRQSAANDQPIIWRKVTPLPEFVYFDHHAHIQKQIGCVSCHGKVSEMSLTRAAHAMTMQFCLNCHKDPEAHIRPQDEVFTDKPLRLNPGQVKDLESQVRELHVKKRLDCFTCHR